jgi:hypothetical protein
LFPRGESPVFIPQRSTGTIQVPPSCPVTANLKGFLMRTYALAIAAAAIFPTALLGLGSGGVVAQIAPGDPAGNQTIPEKDLSRSAEGGTPNRNATSDGNQNLSDKLDKSGGVIKPAENVDPQIVQPAPVPDPNSTPVIPPAGTPGGPPGPEPK